MDIIASYYQSAYKFNPQNNILWKEIVRYLKKYIMTTDRVLDLGSGYCYFINNLECKSKVAIDISPESKNFANSSVGTYTMPYSELDSYFHSEFDIVFASNFFEHLTMEECLDCLKKISSILKPSGKLIIIQPNFKYCFKYYFDDFTHRTVFDDTSMSQILIASEFNPIVIKSKFMPYTTRGKKYLLNKYLIRTYLYSPVKPFAGQMLIIAQLKNLTDG